MKRIAIQGQLGSFHHAVALKYFGDDIEIVSCDTFTDTFTSLRKKEANYVVTAIENSLYGSIGDVFDLLLRHDFPIIGESTEHIRQQLIGFEGTKLSDITEVYSHFAALGQCREWLETNLPNAEIIEHHDTAGAVKHIKEQSLTQAAAIAGSTAAELYQLSIIAADIEDEKSNFTRFFVLGKKASVTDDFNKATLVLTTNHESGALYEALGVFNELHMNMTKLESRSIRGEAFRYQFIVDVEATPMQLDLAFSKLIRNGCDVRLLGAYRASNMPQA